MLRFFMDAGRKTSNCDVGKARFARLEIIKQHHT